MTDERWPVPQSWEWASIGSIAEIVGGGTPDAKDVTNFSSNGIPWLTPADLTGYRNTHIARGARDLSEKGYKNSSAKLMPPGTVLFSSRAPIGYCVVSNNEICTNQGFKSFVLKNDLSPEYLRHYLIASVDYARSKASGTTFQELSGSRAAELAVPIAPIPEQQRIVAKVDGLSAKFRRARDQLGHVPRLVEKYKQAVLAAAFGGELTREWRKEHPGSESGSQLRTTLLKTKQEWERQTSLRRPSHPDLSREMELHSLPPTWTWMPVETIASKVVDGVHKKPSYVSEGIPFLTVRNLTAGPGISFDDCKFISKSDHAEFTKRTNPEKATFSSPKTER
jgi:hypothetical protein